ncbi:MAG: hypothetical protein WD669_02740 [Pirellulales bacterium]
MPAEIEIFVGDVSDVEARVLARYIAPPGVEAEGDPNGPVVISGTLRGPFCEGTRTLPAKFEFRDAASGDARLAEAVVPDPCLWSRELPHVYHVDVEAQRAGRVLAKYQGAIGLQRTSPRRPYDFSTE